MCHLGCLFFFFSSRRRHTRCSRDWSSDVCSSDLAGTSAPAPGPYRPLGTEVPAGGVSMFVQVIQGRVADPGPVHAAHDRWVEEVAPGADRWLGTTAGVSRDADLIGLVPIESDAAVRRKDTRPE